MLIRADDRTTPEKDGSANVGRRVGHRLLDSTAAHPQQPGDALRQRGDGRTGTYTDHPAVAHVTKLSHGRGAAAQKGATAVAGPKKRRDGLATLVQRSSHNANGTG